MMKFFTSKQVFSGSGKFVAIWGNHVYDAGGSLALRDYPNDTYFRLDNGEWGKNKCGRFIVVKEKEVPAVIRTIALIMG